MVTTRYSQLGIRLQRLANAENDSEFRTTLAKKVEPQEADQIFEVLSRTQTDRATDEARAQVQSALRVAQERTAKLRNVQLLQK